MRVPDRRWAETNADDCEGSSRLADRLTRLSAGHPSADLADPDGPEPDDGAPDDLESEPVGPGDGVDRAPTAGFRLRGSVEPATWEALSAKDRSPYRPWFSGDGASDPWFAEMADGPAAD